MQGITANRARAVATFTSFATKCSTLNDGQYHLAEALEATGRTVDTAKTEKMAKMEPRNGAKKISLYIYHRCQNQCGPFDHI
jgi:hypothetical protein